MQIFLILSKTQKTCTNSHTNSYVGWKTSQSCLKSQVLVTSSKSHNMKGIWLRICFFGHWTTTTGRCTTKGFKKPGDRLTLRNKLNTRLKELFKLNQHQKSKFKFKKTMLKENMMTSGMNGAKCNWNRQLLSIK